MTIPTNLLNWAPSSRTVEKVFATLSEWTPTSSAFWNVLDTMALLAPQPSVVWMFPMAALLIAIVHALITRRVDMMVGAALLSLFYTAGHLLLPTIDVPSQTQLTLIITLHTWFSCVASYILFGCVGCSLMKYFIAKAWGYRKTRIARREFELAKRTRMLVKRKKIISKPGVAFMPPNTLEEMPERTRNIQVSRPDTSF